MKGVGGWEKVGTGIGIFIKFFEKNVIKQKQTIIAKKVP